MKTLLLLCIAIMLLCGCTMQTKMPENGTVRTKAMNMTDKAPAQLLETEYEFKSGVNMRMTQFYPNGKKKYEYLMIDSAEKLITVNEYYESGLRMKSSVYRSDSLTAELEWYENGTAKLEFSRTEGKKDKGTLYYPNGKKKEEYEFVDEQRQGNWSQWDSLGNQTRNEMYVNGKLKK